MRVAGLKISRVSWRDLALTVGPFVLLVIVTLWITLHFVHPAPPNTIVMTAGGEGSMFEVYAGRYAKILARQGVTLKILPSQGSLENLKRLSDASFSVDVGFVQGGIASLCGPAEQCVGEFERATDTCDPCRPQEDRPVIRGVR